MNQPFRRSLVRAPRSLDLARPGVAAQLPRCAPRSDCGPRVGDPTLPAGAARTAPSASRRSTAAPGNQRRRTCASKCSRYVAGLRAGMRGVKGCERSSRRPRLWPEAFKSKISTSRTIKSTKAPLATIKLTTISTTVPYRRLTRDRSKLQMLQTPTRLSGQWVRPFGQCFSHPWDLYSHLFTAWPPIHE